MKEIKDTRQATVRILFDGTVVKTYHGPKAEERFANEVRVLRYLGEKKCPFVPILKEEDAKSLTIWTSNCGSVVDRISDAKLKSLFEDLERYGVRHEDPFARNVTYSPQLGHFCLIDFEFATILETGEGLKLEDVALRGRDKTNL